MKTILCIACGLMSSCYFPTDLPRTIDRYPLATGNTWTYTRTFSTFNFRPASPGATFRDTSIVSSVAVQILGRETLQDSPLWKFRSEEHESGRPSFASYLFYRERGDSLILAAYSGGSLFTPQQRLTDHASSRYTLNGRSYLSFRELLNISPEYFPVALTDSIYYEGLPVNVYVFPFSVGLEWQYRERGTAWRMNKRVTGTEAVRTVAGIFSTYKIRWFWDMNDDGVWDTNIEAYDYVSTRGLMKRTFIFKDFAVTNASSPDSVIGYFDAKDEASLNSVDLH